MAEETKDRGIEVFWGGLLATVILFFTWKGAPMLDYMNYIGGLMLQREDLDTSTWLMARAMTLGKISLIAFTAACLVEVITMNVSDSGDTGAITGLAVLIVGPLGWYVGRQYRQALLEQARCKADTWLGCSLEPPLMLGLAFLAVVLILGLSSIATFVTVAGRMLRS